MSTRSTRSKTKHLEADKKQSEIKKENELELAKKKIDKIIDELSSSKKNKVNHIIKEKQKKQKTKYAKKEKAAITIQTRRRGQNTRKNFQKNKPKLLKEYFKKLQLRYKNLQELPLPIVNKIVKNIFENLELDDDDAKNLLVISITTSGICSNFNELLDNLLTLNKKILKDVKELLKIVKNINLVRNRDFYGSSDDDEMTESLMHDNINYYEEQMDKIYEKFGVLITFRNQMIVELKKIFAILKSDTSNDSKLLEEFIKEIDINWSQEIYDLKSKSREEYYKEITDYEKKVETNNTIKSKPIEESFCNLLNNKLIYTDDYGVQKTNIITPINNALKNSNIFYENYLIYFKPKAKTKSKPSKK